MFASQRSGNGLQSTAVGNPIARFGIPSVVAGTFAAVICIPDDLSIRRSLLPSGIAMSIGLLAPILIIAIKRPIELLRADHLLFLGMFYWILMDLVQQVNEPSRASSYAVAIAFLAIGLFAVGVWLGVCFRPWKLPDVVYRSVATQMSANQLFVATCVCFLLAMANYLIASDFDVVRMFAAIGGPRWSEPWAANRFGGWSAFREHLAYFGFLVPSLSVLLALQIGWINVRTVIGLSMAAVCLAFATQGGARSDIGAIVGAAILCWVLLQPRLSLWVLIRMGIALVVLLAGLQIVVIHRNVGLAQLFKAGEAVSSHKPEPIGPDYLHVDDNFIRLSQVIDFIPDKYEHTYGGQIFYILVRPIPRVIWPDKPIGPGFDLPTAIGGNTVTTLSMSIIGELYMDFGLPFVLVGGFLFGRLAGMWNRILFLDQGNLWPLIYGLGTMALFVGIRSEQAFLLRTYPVLFWLIIYRVFLNSSNAPIETRSAAGAVTS